MLVIKAFHIIAMVAWFAGLFYLPRLFVYHTQATDRISMERFCVMERRLYYAIMWPAAILTSVLGLVLLTDGWAYYRSAGWMHAKLLLVVLLWIYHVLNGYYVKQFTKKQKHPQTTGYFRLFNEIPTVLLIIIVLLVVIKP